MPTTVLLIALNQALFFAAISALITVSGLIGLDLATQDSLATLPQTLTMLIAMLSIFPANHFMSQRGRKVGFLIGNLSGVIGSLLACVALFIHSFWLFTFASAFYGISTGFLTFYRFAAMESAPLELKEKALGWVMAAPVVAAFIGPNITHLTAKLFSTPYLGALLCLVVFFAVAFFLTLVMKFAPIQKSSTPQKQSIPTTDTWQFNPLTLTVAMCALGYMLMAFMMTASPLEMKQMSISLGSIAWVIQWHVFAMFAPSFITPKIITRFGHQKTLIFGVVAMAVSLIFATLGASFLVSLIFLGLGWNFLYVGSSALLGKLGALQSEKLKTKAQSINDLSVYAFNTLAVFSAGFLHHWVGFFGVALIGWAILIIITLAAFVIKTKPQPLNQATV